MGACATPDAFFGILVAAEVVPGEDVITEAVWMLSGIPTLGLDDGASVGKLVSVTMMRNAPTMSARAPSCVRSERNDDISRIYVEFLSCSRCVALLCPIGPLIYVWDDIVCTHGQSRRQDESDRT